LNFIGKYIGFQNIAVTGTTYDPDAAALILAAGYTNTAVKLAINSYFVELKLRGYYSKIVKGHLFITDSLDSATIASQFKWNFKNPLDTNAAFRLTPFNNPTNTQSGTTGNGTTQYWETYFNYAVEMPTYANNMGMMTFYIGNTLGVCGIIDGSGAFYKINQTILNNGANTNGSINTNTGTVSVHAGATGAFAVARFAANVQKIYYQGTADGSAATTMQGIPATHTENILRRNNLLLYGTSGVCYHSTFHSLTDAEILDYMNLTNTLQGAIEAALSLPALSRKKY
jgi:hypothetical protein